MKKALAVIGASVLGLGGALVASVGPASADPPTCSDATDAVVSATVDPSANWYMDCVPKYGLGKAEFSITTPAANPFPAGYSLADGHQTVTSSPTEAEVQQYFAPLAAKDPGLEPIAYTGPFLQLAKTASTATSQAYGVVSPPISSASPTIVPQSMAYVISAVDKVTALPTACVPSSDPTATYQSDYEVTYGPTTSTFSETIDNVVHKVTISFTPPPLFLGLNFQGAGGVDGFNPADPLCASSAGNTTFGSSYSGTIATQDDLNWITIAADQATADAYPLTATDPETVPNNFVTGIGTSNALGAFAETSTPILATTGVDPTPAGMWGAGLLGIGAVSLTAATIKRRRRTSRAR